MDYSKFVCKEHNGEQIQRVCLSTSAKNPLFCVDCIMNSNKELKDFLVPVKEFASKMSKDLVSSSTMKFDTKPPESLLSILAEQDALYSKLNSYVDSQKEKVESYFSSLESSLIKILDVEKNK